MRLRQSSHSSSRRAETSRCAAAVIYEDIAARDQAIQLCDRLFRTFQGDLDFDVSWWSFKCLELKELASAAAEAAANANLVFVALNQEGPLPLRVRSWFDEWVPRRRVAHGALVLVAPLIPANIIKPLREEPYFRWIAERANLDYFSRAHTHSLSTVYRPDAWTWPSEAASREWGGDGQVYSESGINE